MKCRLVNLHTELKQNFGQDLWDVWKFTFLAL
jgi:hypothetical protein